LSLFEEREKTSSQLFVTHEPRGLETARYFTKKNQKYFSLIQLMLTRSTRKNAPAPTDGKPSIGQSKLNFPEPSASKKQ